MKVHTLCARFAGLFALALAGLPACGQGTEPSNPKLAPVVALYRDFSWQATLAEPSNAGTDLLRQPKEVLSRYFDDRLTTLLLRERACTKAFGLCALDFSPLWESPDPVGTTLKISNELGTDDVTVRLYHPSRPEATRLSYRVSPSKSGYRISNLRFEDPSRPSLVKMLESPPAR
jgi:hypothetical protein